MRKPLITKETVPTATLDDWLEEFWFVYSVPDLQRNLHETWSMAYEDATRVGEAIRENRLENCLKYLAHTFCWIASFVAKLDKDPSVALRFKIPGFQYQLSEVTWLKYHWKCPNCLQPSCLCPLLTTKPTSEEIEANYSEEARKNLTHPRSVDEWGGMFANIYDKAHFIRSLDELGFHLLEEVGEVEEVIREIATWDVKKPPSKKDLPELQSALVREVADTVSWCFSIVRKIAADAGRYQELEESYGRKRGRAFITPTLTLSKVLWKEYRRKRRNEIGCHKCGKRLCILGEVKWVLKRDSSNEEHTS